MLCHNICMFPFTTASIMQVTICIVFLSSFTACIEVSAFVTPFTPFIIQVVLHSMCIHEHVDKWVYNKWYNVSMWVRGRRMLCISCAQVAP